MSEIQLREQADVPQTQITQVALRELEEAAERAATPEEAQWVMHRAALIKEALEKSRQPYEDCWRAGKSSLLAARKLGALLSELSNDTHRPGYRGSIPSERGVVQRTLGISKGTMTNLLRLARVSDPEFQRYIQSRERVPSMNGALSACRVIKPQLARSSRGSWSDKRRQRLGVKSPRNASFDEAGSLIVKALGHLGGAKLGGPKQSRARSDAMDLLYQAHDLIRPYLGGYVE